MGKNCGVDSTGEDMVCGIGDDGSSFICCPYDENLLLSDYNQGTQYCSQEAFDWDKKHGNECIQCKSDWNSQGPKPCPKARPVCNFWGCNKCGIPAPNGEVCTRDAECASQLCLMADVNRCGSPQDIGQTCKRDKECKPGECPFRVRLSSCAKSPAVPVSL